MTQEDVSHMAENTKKTGKKKIPPKAKKNKIEFVKDIIKIVNDNDIAEFRYEKDDIKISIMRGHEVVTVPVVTQLTSVSPVGVPAAQEEKIESSKPVENANNYYEIESPMIGTFYQSSSPKFPPFVKLGDRVSVDTTVCIVEAMKLMNEIKSGTNGVLKEVLVKNEDAVTEGTVLFRVEAD